MNNTNRSMIVINLTISFLVDYKINLDIDLLTSFEIKIDEILSCISPKLGLYCLIIKSDFKTRII